MWPLVLMDCGFFLLQWKLSLDNEAIFRITKGCIVDLVVLVTHKTGIIGAEFQVKHIN